MAAFDAEGTNAICSGATVIGTAGGSSSSGGWGRWKRSNRFEKRQGPGGRNGMGGMGGESGSIYQPYIQVTLSTQNAGTQLTVKDSSNNIIASYTPINTYSSVLVTSPKMVSGASYTVIAGNSSQTAVASSPANGTVNAPSITTPGSVSSSSSSASSNSTTNTASCSTAILNQGYQCCSAGCTVYYTDSDGTWGVENGQWCGCGNSNNSSASASCPSSITSQGYACCSSGNCDVYYTDDSGKWGVEGNQWCGISNSC
jgi:hypothetical protein